MCRIFSVQFGSVAIASFFFFFFAHIDGYFLVNDEMIYEIHHILNYGCGIK